MQTQKQTENSLVEQCFIRGYHRHSKAWYSQTTAFRASNVDITFGMYCPNEGTFAEMRVEWVPLRSGVSSQIKAFEDSWILFGLFEDFFKKLGEYQGKDVSEEEFATLLDWYGFKDLTQYENATNHPC
ncbi:MAG: hypothetical protein JNJ47_05760 [Alphaproteobacteria bacterium]|nr:hypothetical protein [Alphaproteobacteria bacterium]